MPHSQNHRVMCENEDCQSHLQTAVAGTDSPVTWVPTGGPGVVPEVSMLLMSSRKPSSATCASVNRKIIILFSSPSFMYRFFRSSRKLVSE